MSRNLLSSVFNRTLLLMNCARTTMSWPVCHVTPEAWRLNGALLVSRRFVGISLTFNEAKYDDPSESHCSISVQRHPECALTLNAVVNIDQRSLVL